MNSIKTIINNQKLYFSKEKTRDISFRKKQLEKLYKSIKQHENEILIALKSDLNKSAFEAYETEVGMVYEELKFMLKNIKNFSKPRRIKTPLMHFPSKSYQYQDPYGCVLIMSPWNYPFQLTLVPLIGAIAAGNCAVVKPSNYAKETSRVILKILSEFPQEYIAVVEGGRDVNNALLEEKFDYIFFTGSPLVGKLVMEKAAQHLTPMTLELGGKSPCIIDKTAKIDLAAKRVAWGKLLNSGQTCVAPDYIIVHESIKNEFINALKKYIEVFYGKNPEKNPEYPKIINKIHFDRLSELINNSENVYGGKTNSETYQIAPAIIDNCQWDGLVMKDEIFGPILPIISYNDLDEIIKQINSRPKPLALYCFTESKTIENKILKSVLYGGGCINDTVLHLANPYLSFGGVGESGLGKYHGKESFYTFSHTKSVLKRGTSSDINLRYAPYKDNLKLIKKILK
ncbi:MAG TPA: aldehyde dehydrogenase family protein [Clostridiales bacterium]|nr:aldehyde dehydrogenase family protein [Clostridiales bacterium]